MNLEKEMQYIFEDILKEYMQSGDINDLDFEFKKIIKTGAFVEIFEYLTQFVLENAPKKEKIKIYNDIEKVKLKNYKWIYNLLTGSAQIDKVLPLFNHSLEDLKYVIIKIMAKEQRVKYTQKEIDVLNRISDYKQQLQSIKETKENK